MTSISDAQAKWSIIAVVLAADVVWAYSAGISVTFAWWAVGSILCLFAVEYVYKHIRKERRIAEFAAVCGQLMAFNWVMAVLMYLTATTRYPLVDHRLAVLDHMIGFDWLAAFQWVREHPVVQRTFTVAYNSIFPQVFVLLIALNATGRLDRCREFVWLYFLCALFMLPFSVFLPAASAWVHFGVQDLIDAYHLPHFNALRSGEMTEIVLAKTQGLVTFPSFHTAIAIMVVYSARGVRFLFPAMLLANSVMILSIPTEGGHYLVDVLAGAALTFIAIAAIRWWQAHVDRLGKHVAQRLARRPAVIAKYGSR